MARKRPQRHCCVAPPVECPLCPDGQEFKPGNLNGKFEKLATKATKTEATCDKFKGQKRVRKCCEATKTYTPDDFALTKANECPAGTKTPDYKTCHDQASNYKWPGQPAGHTQRWDEEGHDPEFGAGWPFMPPGCVLYTGWPSGSHAAQVRWNPNQNGKNDGHRAKVCEKDDGTDGTTPTQAPPATCTCRMTCDNDIDFVYIDGKDVTSTIENYANLGAWEQVKTLTFGCGKKTQMAVQATDGDGTPAQGGGCRGGGFVMKCTSTDTSSPWHGREADLTWKALGRECANTNHPAGSNVCRMQGGGDAKSELIDVPNNWYSKKFDDSAWPTALQGATAGGRTTGSVGE